jgi:hypothetical protein
MKKIIISLIVIVLFASCGGDKYKGYDGYWVNVDYARSSVAAPPPALYLYCDGPGDECKVGGPKDGVLIPTTQNYNRSSPDLCIVDSLEVDDPAIIDKIHTAFSNGTLPSLASNSRFNMVFRKANDRQQFLNYLNQGQYGITQFQNGDFAVYNGQVLDGNFIYITKMPK